MAKKKRKTRDQKIKASYRLQDFSINVEDTRKKKEIQGFGYLGVEFVKRDLLKTVIFSIMIVGLELYLANLYP